MEKINKTLNGEIFNGYDKLEDKVYKRLLLIVKYFLITIEYKTINSSLSKNVIKDITLTGSMMGYGYHDESDIDVHFICDFDSVDIDNEILQEMLNNKARMFKDSKDITIYGHKVEFYFQDKNEEHHTEGEYSLIKNDWIKKPNKPKVEIKKQEIKKIYNHFKEKLEKIQEIDDNAKFIIELNELKDEIKSMRQKSLNTKDEIYSSGNLAFKYMRNIGFIDKINEIKKERLEKILSLESYILKK